MRRAFAIGAGSVVVALATMVGCATTPVPRVSDATTPEAAGLVDIRSRIPDLSLDMR